MRGTASPEVSRQVAGATAACRRRHSGAAVAIVGDLHDVGRAGVACARSVTGTNSVDLAAADGTPTPELTGWANRPRTRLSR